MIRSQHCPTVHGHHVHGLRHMELLDVSLVGVARPELVAAPLALQHVARVVEVDLLHVALQVRFYRKHRMTILTDVRVLAGDDSVVACEGRFLVGEYHGRVETSSVFLVRIQTEKT